MRRAVQPPIHWCWSIVCAACTKYADTPCTSRWYVSYSYKLVECSLCVCVSGC